MVASPGENQHAYLAIADSLRIDIQTGQFNPGDKLPTARELMSRHGVATHTVTSALKVLQDEGLTYSVHGRGTFVREDLDVSKIGVVEPVQSNAEMEKTIASVVEAVQRMETEMSEIRQELGSLRKQIDPNS